MDKLLVSPLYELAWQQLVFSFKDMYGKLIPRVQRVELVDYMTKGIVPSGLLGAILFNDFRSLTLMPLTSLERERIRTVSDFVYLWLPRQAYGSYLRVSEFADYIRSGQLGYLQKQYM